MTGQSELAETVLCGTNVVGQSGNGSKLYVWIACGSFTTGATSALLTGSAEPAVVTVQGGGASVEVTDVQFPRQAHLNDDIDQMFPSRIADRMKAGDLPASPSNDQLLEEARKLN
jgi:hypothetical protein